MSNNLGVVCVVDDDAAVRSALKFVLEVEGVTVRLYDGAAALLAERHLPRCGCLIVDYVMPLMTGLELVATLRTRGVHTPVIMITGSADKALRRQAEKLGVSSLLEKPLSDGVLIESIRSALAGRR